MTLKEAIKKELVVEVESDLYLTDNGRILKYDRYFHKNPKRYPVCNMWIDEEGNCFESFSAAYYRTSAYRWA